MLKFSGKVLSHINLRFFHSLILFLIILLHISVFQGCKKLPFVPDDGSIIYLGVSDATIEPGETVSIFVRGEKDTGYPLGLLPES